MSTSNKPTGIKRQLPDDENKPTVQSGNASSSSHVQPAKPEQFDESESKPFLQSGATFSVVREPRQVNQENFQVKLDEAASPVSHIFDHMAKCTLGNQCTTPNCSSIKSMAKHWLSCASADCSICAPFQSQSNNSPIQISGTQTNVPNMNNSQPLNSGLQLFNEPKTQSNNPLPQIYAKPIPVSKILSSNIPQHSFSQAPAVQPAASGGQTNSTNTEQYEFLLNKLKNSKTNPSTTGAYKETQQEVLNILKVNPNLKATFIEKRQELLQLHQQQLQKQSQSSIDQSHNPQMPQTSHQSVPVTQANVLTPSIPQHSISPLQVSDLQPSSTSTQALQLLTLLRNTNNDPQAQQQVLNILKSQPALMASFIKQRQMQTQQQQQSQSCINQSTNPLPQVSYPPVPGVQTNAPKPNFPQASISQVPATEPPATGTQANVPNPNISQPQVSGLQPSPSNSPTAYSQTLKQLLSILRNTNNNPQAQQQVLNILKANPALMANFIKQRQEQQRQQQQQHD